MFMERTFMLSKNILNTLLTAFGFFIATSFGHAQPVPIPGQPIQPVSVKPSATSQSKTTLEEGKLTPLQKQFLHSGKSGADWLFRVNTMKGRFLNGIRPALKAEMEDENFLHQAGAAYALAKAAKIFKEERFAARASQSLLLLLEDTMTDSKDSTIRYTLLPNQVLDRQASAGLMLLAIHELPNPQSDLLEAGEQLANYLRAQIQSNGSIDKESAVEEMDSKGSESAIAICAILKSNHLRPASWKTDIAYKAIAARWNAWKNQKEFAPTFWRVEALRLAYSISHEKAYANLCFELADKMATMQFDRIDPRKPNWFGGLKQEVVPGMNAPPSIMTALLAQGFVSACQCAQLAADQSRSERYQSKLEQALQFTQTLQYTEANTLHFSDWFRSRLLGGFHRSLQDGDLRLDYSYHAVMACCGYQECLGSAQ